MTPGQWVELMWTLGPVLAATYVWHKFDQMIKRGNEGVAKDSEYDLLRILGIAAASVPLPLIIMLMAILFWPVLVLLAAVEYLLKGLVWLLAKPEKIEGKGESE